MRHGTNAGKAASLWDGIQRALGEGADVVITMDGDGQHNVDDVPRLLRALAAHPSRVAIGARMRRQRPDAEAAPLRQPLRRLLGLVGGGPSRARFAVGSARVSVRVPPRARPGAWSVTRVHARERARHRGRQARVPHRRRARRRGLLQHGTPEPLPAVARHDAHRADDRGPACCAGDCTCRDSPAACVTARCIHDPTNGADAGAARYRDGASHARGDD